MWSRLHLGLNESAEGPHGVPDQPRGSLLNILAGQGSLSGFIPVVAHSVHVSQQGR